MNVRDNKSEEALDRAQSDELNDEIGIPATQASGGLAGEADDGDEELSDDAEAGGA
jgi:hypothetical protein